MKITNKHNLPTPYVTAAIPFPPSKEDRFRISELTQPPQIAALYRQHFDDLEEDAIDRLWALSGSAKHFMLEKHEGEGVMTEVSLEGEYGGLVVSGQLDCYENATIYDYKNTSVWSVKAMLAEGVRDDYVKQLNWYKVLFNRQCPNLPVDRLALVCEAKDWRPIEKKRYGDDYPDRITVIDVAIQDDAEAQLEKALEEHRAAREGNARPCTDTETWKRPDQYAVMKKGRKSALRVLDTPEDAEAWIEQESPAGEISIEYRPGGYIRCEDYCAVKNVCPQYQNRSET